MKLNLATLPIALAVLLAASACTAEQAYYSGQTWQRNECDKLPDPGERERCLSKLDTGYEDYQRQKEDNLNR